MRLSDLKVGDVFLTTDPVVKGIHKVIISNSDEVSCHELINKGTIVISRGHAVYFGVKIIEPKMIPLYRLIYGF